MPYILTFCRIVTGLVFAASFWGKAQNMNQFVQTITNFKLLPNRYSKPLSLLFLLGELIVMSLILVGGSLLPRALCEHEAWAKLTQPTSPWQARLLWSMSRPRLQPKLLPRALPLPRVVQGLLTFGGLSPKATRRRGRGDPLVRTP